MEQLVLNLLRRCGVPVAARCNLIVLEAVRYVLTNPMSIYGAWTSDALPGIARACSCSASSVEEGIRMAIDYCYQDDGGMTLELALGINGKPKPRVLIGRLMEVVRNEKAREGSAR